MHTRQLQHAFVALRATLTSMHAAFAAGNEAAESFEAAIERYVTEGLRSSLALRGKGLEVECTATALASAIVHHSLLTIAEASREA